MIGLGIAHAHDVVRGEARLGERGSRTSALFTPEGRTITEPLLR